jgi:hypothetical protein
LDNSKRITATVCVYSGRPNPQWPVSKKEYDKLLLAVASLALATATEPPSLLGYSGILVTAGTVQLYIFNGSISVRENKISRGFTDKSRIIEKKLLTSMPAFLKKEVKRLLPAELR